MTDVSWNIPKLPLATVDLDILRPSTIASILADYDSSPTADVVEEALWQALVDHMGAAAAARAIHSS